MFHNVITKVISDMLCTIALFCFGHLLKLSHYTIWFEYNIILKLVNDPHFNIPLLRAVRILLNSAVDLIQHLGEYPILDFNIFRYNYIFFLLVHHVM